MLVVVAALIVIAPVNNRLSGKGSRQQQSNSWRLYSGKSFFACCKKFKTIFFLIIIRSRNCHWCLRALRATEHTKTIVNENGSRHHCNRPSVAQAISRDLRE